MTRPTASVRTTTTLSPVQVGYRWGLALALGGAVLFSAKAIVAKLMYRYQIDAMTLLAMRMSMAVPVFIVIAFLQRNLPAPLVFADHCRLIALGFVGYYLSSFLDFVGLQYISAGLERLILFLTPTFVLLISAVLHRRGVTSRQWATVLLAYAGLILVVMHDLDISHLAPSGQILLGSGAVLAAAVCYAVYLIGSGEMVQRVGTLRLVSYAMCVSAVVSIVQFILLRPLSVLVQPAAVYALSGFNALFCTVMPVLMTMMAVSRIGAPAVSQASMVGPVSMLFLAWWALDEPITAWQLAGSALVLSGIYLLSREKPVRSEPA